MRSDIQRYAILDVKEAARLSQLVLSIDQNDPEALACVGWAKAFVSDDAVTAAEMVESRSQPR